RQLTHGEGAETTMDCTGLPEPRVAAVRSAATWGRVAFVGEGGDTTFDISRDMIRKQLTLVASWTFSATGQWEGARFVADRKIPPAADFPPPLQAGRARGRLPPLRPADHRQGRLPVLGGGRPPPASPAPPAAGSRRASAERSTR